MRPDAGMGGDASRQGPVSRRHPLARIRGPRCAGPDCPGPRATPTQSTAPALPALPHTEGLGATGPACPRQTGRQGRNWCGVTALPRAGPSACCRHPEAVLTPPLHPASWGAPREHEGPKPGCPCAGAHPLGRPHPLKGTPTPAGPLAREPSPQPGFPAASTHGPARRLLVLAQASGPSSGRGLPRGVRVGWGGVRPGGWGRGGNGLHTTLTFAESIHLIEGSSTDRATPVTVTKEPGRLVTNGHHPGSFPC